MIYTDAVVSLVRRRIWYDSITCLLGLLWLALVVCVNWCCNLSMSFETTALLFTEVLLIPIKFCVCSQGFLPNRDVNARSGLHPDLAKIARLGGVVTGWFHLDWEVTFQLGGNKLRNSFAQNLRHLCMLRLNRKKNKQGTWINYGWPPINRRYKWSNQGTILAAILGEFGVSRRIQSQMTIIKPLSAMK
jgi:hypothetical protein